MGSSRVGQMSVASLVGSSILTTVLAQRLSSTETELYSEMVCWMTLPFILRKTPFISVKHQPAEPLLERAPVQRSLLLRRLAVALGVAIASLYKTEFGLIELFPALTPLLFLLQRHFRPRFGLQNKPDSSFLSFLGFTPSGTALIAILSIGALLGLDFRQSGPCVVALIAWLVVYTMLMPRHLHGSVLPAAVDVDKDLPALSLTIAVTLLGALALQHATLGLPRGQVVPVLVLGILKTLSWCLTIQAVRHSTWHMGAAIGSFCIMAVRDPARLSSEIQALAQLAASCLSLAQIISMIPKRTRTSNSLWLFVLLPAIPYFLNLAAILNEQWPSTPTSRHPVEALIQQAERNFWNLTQRQSKSFHMACEEYRRRYAMEPPPGFDGWYNYAVSKQSPIIDDFDAIYRGISPFLALSGSEVNRIMSSVYENQDSEVWKCQFSGTFATTRCRHAWRSFDRHISTLFESLLKDVPGKLPDVQFLVNHLDEPRVVLPPAPTPESPGIPLSSWKLTDLSHQPTWNVLIKPCPPNFHKNPLRDYPRLELLGLPFVEGASAQDTCKHPEFQNMHGIFLSPTSMKLIEGMVPVLSTGAVSTMGDILHPSPAYNESEFQYSPENDVDWDKKRNQMYWTGSNTGGVTETDDGWRLLHRQRFVKLAQGQRNAYQYLEYDLRGFLRRVTSSFLNGRLYNVAFTRIFQCVKSSCRRQRTYFGVRSWEDKDEALKSRLVFDIDGNGISGRFYKLLASNSLPLKQTLFREWHDDRLVPWMHYVPVSQSMDELPELVRYLTSTERGRQRAEEMAQHGKDWFSRAFRQEDLGVYTYRLLLELARIQDPQREAFRPSG